MPGVQCDFEPSDLLVAIRHDFTVRRDVRTWEELLGEVISNAFVTVTPRLHGMFLGRKSTENRPDGIAIYIPSEAAVIVALPGAWKLLWRVKNKAQHNR